jgi:glycosyltransferase involved in cell wall biosynthesis
VRILVFAYACEPGKGSEPEAGWMWSRMLARLGETWVITRANNREAIESQLHRIPERDRLHFQYVDLPPSVRRWKRGQRGVRLYYLLWQWAALRRARQLHASLRYDLVWHLTLANAWLGSVGPMVGAPFVYGPVGGGVTTPTSLLPVLGVRGLAYEAARRAARTWGRFMNPLARLAWARARLILVQSSDTRRWLPSRHRSKTEVLPNVMLDGPPSRRPTGRSTKRRVLFGARTIAWKGGALALRAMASMPDWTLLVAGSGSDGPRLRRLARKLGVQRRVHFLGHVPRDELLELMRHEADVFLYPSLHDDAGWAVVEAASFGLPVVCVAVGGPPELGGRGAPVSSPRRTVAALADAVREAEGAAPAPVEPFFLDSREAKVRALLDSAGLLFPSTQTRATAGAR